MTPGKDFLAVQSNYRRSRPAPTKLPSALKTWLLLIAFLAIMAGFLLAYFVF